MPNNSGWPPSDAQIALLAAATFYSSHPAPGDYYSPEHVTSTAETFLSWLKEH